MSGERTTLYEERRRHFLRLRERRAVVAERLAWARLAALIGAIVLAVAWSGRVAGVGAAALLIVFAALVRRHGAEKRQIVWLDGLARVNAEAAHRVRREWDAIPVPDWRSPPADHPYADDLDLLGHGSLSQLLPPVSSSPGQEILRRWLLEPTGAAETRARQAAVAELAPKTELRDALTLLGRRIWVADEKRKSLEQWASGDPWLGGRSALTAASILLPLVTLALGVGALTERLPATLWIFPVVASAMLTALNAVSLRKALVPLADHAEALAGYSEMTRRVSDASFEAPFLRERQDVLGQGNASSFAALGSLRRLADSSQVRSSPMLHVVLQWLFLWDVHVVRLTERWQARHGRQLADWLGALGEIESVAALAALAHGNPGWAFPTIDDGAVAIEATALGHPLLPDGVRVANDVTVGGPGSFLLVTGSNMSGKSTLLRAIGVNVVLAQAGAPVCATRLRLPPVALHTSMRIRDSLERGVSYFMAEVLRLKEIVDATRAEPHGRLVLYLFDEMLQGTNAAERTIAAQRIIAFLLSGRAIGAVATHDLRLLDSPVVAAAATLVHFREEVGAGVAGPTLRFDYRLRAGPASTTNALRLMALAGLPVSDR